MVQVRQSLIGGLVYDGPDPEASSKFSMLPWAVAASFKGFRDDVAGIKQFTWSLTAGSMRRTIIDWTDAGLVANLFAGSGTISMETMLPTTGDTFYVLVKATSFPYQNEGQAVYEVVSSSSGFTLQTSAASVESVALELASSSNALFSRDGSAQFYSNAVSSPLQTKYVLDDTSRRPLGNTSLSTVYVGLGTTPYGSDIVQFTPGDFDRISGTKSQLYQHGGNNGIDAGLAALAAGSDGKTVYSTVVTVNEAGLFSYRRSSNGIVFDVTSPIGTSSKIKTGISCAIHQCEQSRFRVRCSWRDIRDPESGVRFLSVDLVTFSALVPDQRAPVTDAGTVVRYNVTHASDFALFDNVELISGATYACRIEAENNVGLTSVFEDPSGAVADNSPPVPSATGLQKVTEQATSFYLTSAGPALLTFNAESQSRSHCSISESTHPLEQAFIQAGHDQHTLHTSLSDVSFRWAPFTDPESVVVRYSIALFEIFPGLDDPEIVQRVPFTSVPSSSFTNGAYVYSFRDVQLSSKSMWAEVLAINAAGLQSSIRSAPFRVVPECALTVRGSAPLVIRSLDGNLNVSWAFDLPTHAACQRAGWNIVSPRWFYAVGTRPFATDLLEFTLGPLKDNPDDPASVGGDLQLIGLPLQTKQRIYLSFVTVNCVSGIKTHVFSTLNDIAPPVPAAPIFDGGRIGVDATVQADATALTANWLSFIDAETFVVSYEWAIGSAPFAEDVQSFTMVNRSVAYTAALGSWKVAATGLALVVNSTYYVTVRATDYMGNAATAASDGILVSLLFPLPGDIVLTSIAHEDDPVNEDAEAFYQSDVTSVHIRWFNFWPSALGVGQGGNNTFTNGTSAPIDATANCEWNDIECRKQADASLQPAQSFVDAAGISIADYSVGLSTLAGIEHGRYDVTTLRSVGLVSSYTFAGLNLSAGVYVATVQVTNSLGHTTFATSANVIVDITAPRVISSKPVAIAQALSFGFVRGPVLDVNWSTSFSEPESIITRYSYTVLHVNQKLSATCRVPASLLQAAVWHTTTLTSVQLRLERPGISYRVFVKARNGASLDSEAAQSRTVVWDPTEPTAGKVYHVPQQGDDFQFASNYQTVTNQVSAVWYESNTATGTPTFCQPFELADSLSSASRPSWTIAQGSSYSRSVIWSAQNALFEPRGATLSARSNIAAHTGVGAQIGRRLSFPFPYREEHPSFVNVETQASVSFSLRAASGFNYRTAIFIIYPASSAALSSDTVYALSSEAGVYRDSGMFGLVIDLSLIHI